MGWEISVFRQTSDLEKPATPSSQRGDRVAVWQAWSNGLDWIDRMVRISDAIHVGDDGFSTHWYSATASTILPYLAEHASNRTSLNLKSAIDMNDVVAAQCCAEEWLLIEAVDIS